MDSSIVPQILSKIGTGDAMTLVTAAGLALISLAFLSYVLSIAINAASGRITDEESEEYDKSIN